MVKKTQARAWITGVRTGKAQATSKPRRQAAGKLKLAPARYAHPFFTAAPPDSRAAVPALHANRMSDFIHASMGPIPAARGTATLDLKDVIGQSGIDDINRAGKIRFHAVGDTGRADGSSQPQEEVALAMMSDYDPATPGDNPAFLLHLGDVIYGHRKAALYRDEFYRPYMKYPGKILAIAGNHDGEIFSATDPKPLEAFLANFCATTAALPPIASEVRIFRETMIQPGVYWLLKTPFVNVIGLYSNIAEGPGDLTGKGGDTRQLKWLKDTVARLSANAVDKKKALVVATHHPPFSAGGHSGSPKMLQQIDGVFDGSGILPHVMLAGHSHNYQYYLRSVDFGGGKAAIPCLVAGCGGHADSQVGHAADQVVGDAVFRKSMKGYGYLTVTVTADDLTIEMFDTSSLPKRRFNKIAVNLATRAITSDDT